MCKVKKRDIGRTLSCFICVPECACYKCFLAHLSRRLKGELIVYRSIQRPCVSASVGKHFQTRISPQPVGQS